MNEDRIAVVYRADLDMPRGKGEVQFGHAMVGLFSQYGGNVMHNYLKDTLQMKLSMEAADLEELMVVASRASKRNIPYVIVTDAGRTVFNGEPTITCVGIGPMNKTDSNAILRGIRMRV